MNFYKRLFEPKWWHAREQDLKCSQRQALQLLFYYYLVLYVPLWYVDYFELKASETLQAQEKLLFPLNYLEEFKFGAWSTGVITRNGFYLPVGQGKLIITEQELSLQCLQAQRPGLIPSSECLLDLNCPLSLNLLCWGVPIHMYEIKFGHFLLLIRIVSSWSLEQRKEPWGWKKVSSLLTVPRFSLLLEISHKSYLYWCLKDKFLWI